MRKKRLSSLEFTSVSRRNLRTIVVTTLVMMVIGIAYTGIVSTFNWHSLIVGAAVGCILGLVGTPAELYWFTRVSRSVPFTAVLAIRTTFYVLLVHVAIFGVHGYHMSLMYGIPFTETFARPEFRNYLGSLEMVRDFVFILAVVFMSNFIREINRLLGQNALMSFITGKYFKPIEEQRIFMFVDLKDSTAIAEKLGHQQYHAFLNDFVHDITPGIIESRGEIYQYVGDEVVITWTAPNGLREANCVRCFFRIAASLHLREPVYRKKYGFIPGFKAGYHYGPVIAGEIGDVKKEIVFHGDTVNTAARIRSECTRLRKDLLLSGDLLSRIAIDDILTPEMIGKIKLRGKEEEVELFTIAEAA